MSIRHRLVGGVARLAATVVLGGLLTTTAQATLQVDCDSPDDFCTGSPCVTVETIEVVAASCVLDFGARPLLLDHRITVADGGVLSLTAGSISVGNTINGRHVTNSAGNGAHISLVAAGDIVVDRPIDVSGRATNGSLLIDAGGNLFVNARLRARARGSGATASGGAVTLLSAGAIAAPKKGRIEVRGRKNDTAAGVVSIAGQGDVTLAGRIEARGTPAGTVTVSSASGDVSLLEEIRANGENAAGGTVLLSAAGNLVTGNRLTVAGQDAPAGTILADAGGSVSLAMAYARGGVGGTVAATAADVSVSTITVRGTSQAGSIALTSTAGSVTATRLDGRAGGDGGQVSIDASGDVALEDASLDGGTTGGALHVTAGGDIELGESASAQFDVQGATGGTIEAAAAGNLTARGTLLAATGGCIGLSAGLVLDTSAASIDVPLTPACP